MEKLIASHSTIKFTGEWLKQEKNFSDVNIRRRNSQIGTDLHIKPADTHQFIDSTSCHTYHCKKSIPYSQALPYNRICSKKKKSDQQWYDLEKWLMEKDYRKRMVTTHILKARAESKNSVLERCNTITFKNKLTLTSLTIHRFRMLEAYWRTFKFC